MENKWSKNIYLLRKQAKISQKELAEKIGVTQRSIGFWETGVNEPKASYIVALAKYFGVSADYLLGLED
ncbi:MAG: helix-turn-helix domain-containing protein [Christensenellales bacterium]